MYQPVDRRYADSRYWKGWEVWRPGASVSSILLGLKNGSKLAPTLRTMNGIIKRKRISRVDKAGCYAMIGIIMSTAWIQLIALP